MRSLVRSRTRALRPSRRGSCPLSSARACLFYLIYLSFRLTTRRTIRWGDNSISLLTDFEDAATYLDWTVGVHGIHISFMNPALSGVLSDASGTPTPVPSAGMRSGTRHLRRPLTATYLPDVMPEQGWDQLDAVDSAIRKAGWDGLITEDLRRSLKLRRYQSSRCSVNYDEFIEWRQENGAQV